MKYIKVVYKYSVESEYSSAYVSGKYELQYSMGLKTIAPSNSIGIFSFRTLKQALQRYNATYYAFLLGEGLPISNPSKGYCANSTLIDDWYAYRNGLSTTPISSSSIELDFPGTVLLEWFKPLQLLEQEVVDQCEYLLNSGNL